MNIQHLSCVHRLIKRIVIQRLHGFNNGGHLHQSAQVNAVVGVVLEPETPLPFIQQDYFHIQPNLTIRKQLMYSVGYFGISS